MLCFPLKTLSQNQRAQYIIVIGVLFICCLPGVTIAQEEGPLKITIGRTTITDNQTSPKIDNSPEKDIIQFSTGPTGPWRANGNKDQGGNLNDWNISGTLKLAPAESNEHKGELLIGISKKEVLILTDLEITRPALASAETLEIQFEKKLPSRPGITIGGALIDGKFLNNSVGTGATIIRFEATINETKVLDTKDIITTGNNISSADAPTKDLPKQNSGPLEIEKADTWVLKGKFTIGISRQSNGFKLEHSAEVGVGVLVPTLITLSSFSATAGNGQALLEWITGAEIDNEGFNILRSEAEEGLYTKLNDILIPAKAIQPSGASYEFSDTTVENGKTYFYKLEDVDTSGKKTEHGPLKITVIEGDTASLKESDEVSTGTTMSDTGSESSTGFGCGFIKPDGNPNPPTGGEMAGIVLALSLPFVWAMLRRVWKHRTSLRIQLGSPLEAP